MHSFFVALQFLTRLPSPIRREISLDELGASIGWFPLVGAALGSILLAVDLGAGQFLDAHVVDALLVATLVALTGALHLDGVIDTLDGFTAGPDRQVQLDAMRETRAGTAGAIAGILTLLATCAAITALPPFGRMPTLFIAPLAGRTAILLAYSLYPYTRPGPGLSHSLKRGATPRRMLGGIAAAAALAGAAGGIGGLAVLVLVLGWVHGVASISCRRIGGLTGDVIGAICEGSQLITLIALPFLHLPGGAWGLWAPVP